MPTPNDAELQRELERRMILYRHDPLGHAKYSYTWGQGELEHFKGPRRWQAEVLDYIGQCLRKGAKTAIRVAVRSGNGVGKTALIALLCNWGLSTGPDTRVNLTAETELQLRTKTWPEIAIWFYRFICKHWFNMGKTTIHSLQKNHEETWKLDRVTWSASRPESFAGLHNIRKRILLIMDEASAIDDVVFETAEGALTDADTEIIFLVFGNGTRNTGYFHEIFHSKQHLWKTWEIDSRTVEGINPEQIKLWENDPDRGLGTDWFRVHVAGQEPEATELQFISGKLVEAGLKANVTISQYGFAPKIIGVDTAWWGGDEIAVVLRQGLFSKLLFTLPQNDDDTRLGGMLAAVDDEYKADAVFIDIGYGTGVYSYGKMIGRKHWQLISFAETASDPYYENKRAEMWGETKAWLKQGGCLPDKKMGTELTYPEAWVNRRGKLQLESKEQMRERKLPSPGRADALALTFARKVLPKPEGGGQYRMMFRQNKKKYDPLAF